MRLAAFLAGVACGIGVCLWWVARAIVTPETVPSWVHDEDALPPDPYIRDLADILRRERW